MDLERLFTGEERPPQIPDDWLGEPLPDDQGWRWLDPADRGNSVRIYRPDPTSPDPVRHGPTVVVTVQGEMIDAQGKPTGEFLKD